MRAIPLSLLLLLPGCAAIHNARNGMTNTAADAPLPPNFAQPRLAELLDYLGQQGIEEAPKASIFQFTAWPMYRHPDWNSQLRKPRYEGAEFHHNGMKIIVAISPIEPWHEPEKLLETQDKQNRTTGAVLLIPDKTWTLAFTLEKPDPDLQARYSKYLTNFLHQWHPELIAGDPHFWISDQ